MKYKTVRKTLEMRCLFLILVTISILNTCVSFEFRKLIHDYFKSEDLKNIGSEWNTIYRRPIEHALAKTMQETVGSSGLNVYIRKRNEILAAGYLHNDNQVRVIFGDLALNEMPKFHSPQVQFSLTSNNLRLEAFLTAMIVHADYALIRNKSAIIHDPRLQDPYKSSPFLFEQVQDVGKVAITIEGCRLKGTVLPFSQGSSISLGYTNMQVFDCQHTIEIYTPGLDAPPVIAKYNLGKCEKYNNYLQIDRLLLKPLIQNELIPKLQAAVFSFVNTTEMFGSALKEFRENQEIINQIVAKHFTDLAWHMNGASGKKMKDVTIPEYEEHWDDGRKRDKPGESLKLKDMTLTGLNTLYSSHSGGPRLARGKEVVICEKFRFSSLQAQGKIELKSAWSGTFDFSADLDDLTLDLEVTQPEHLNNTKETATFNVDGLSRMTFTMPSLVFGSAKNLIGGYLLSAVPKLLIKSMTRFYEEAIKNMKSEQSDDNKPDVTTNDPSANDDTVDDNEVSSEESDTKETQSSIEMKNLKGSSETSYEIQRVRDTFKKSKKRFKSSNRSLYSRLRSAKRMQKNLL